MSETRPFLCAACKVPLQGFADAEKQIVGCPVCGVSDTLENVVTEAGKHMISKMTDDMFSGIAMNSTFLKVTVTKSEEPVYRFIMGDEQG